MADETVFNQQMGEETVLHFIKRWRAAMDKYKVSAERKILYESWAGEVITAADGNVDRIIFNFAMQGRYVDMGVGRGWPIGGKSNRTALDKYLDKDLMGKHDRRPKKIYASPLQTSTNVLMKILYNMYGNEAIQVMEGTIEKANPIDIGIG